MFRFSRRCYLFRLVFYFIVAFRYYFSIYRVFFAEVGALRRFRFERFSFFLWRVVGRFVYSFG